MLPAVEQNLYFCKCPIMPIRSMAYRIEHNANREQDRKKQQVQTRWGASQLYVLNAYMVRWAYQVNYTAPASLTCQLSRRKEVGGQLKQCKNIKKARMCQSAHHLHIWPSAHCHMTLIAQINQFLNWTPTLGVLMDAIKYLKRHLNIYFKKGETLPKSLCLKHHQK